MNQKQLDNTVRRIRSIENESFTEDDIKLLLIEIRDILKGESFLREICHFVAHPNRDKGICHKRIDSRFAKFKYYKEKTDLYFTEEFIKQHKGKPERFFTDKFLSYLKTEKVEKKLFELVIIDGIDEIENQLFLKYYNMNKKQVKKLIKSSYNLINSHYHVSTSLSVKEFLFLDDILKFIRGCMTGKSVFTKNELQNDFLKALHRVENSNKLVFDTKKIKAQLDDVIVTIFSIIHESTLILFDGSVGNIYLSVHPKSQNDKESVICLMSDSEPFHAPIIMTNIDSKRYIETDESYINEFQLKKIPWIYTVRDSNGKIKLRTNGV